MGGPKYRVGVDIGGTFTDVVLLSSDGKVFKEKLSSTPPDYSIGIVNGILAALESCGGSPKDVIELVHATTVATNAVLERKGAKTALITTEGFRDVLEFGRLRVAKLYDLQYSKPPQLVPRRFRFEVRERMLADGSVRTPLEMHNLQEIADTIVKHDVKAVAISLLHSYKNPGHEKKVQAAISKLLPEDIFVTCSHEILPEIREYERTSTTVVNAYLGPIVKKYLRSLMDRLQEAGIGGRLRIMQSGGGLMSAEAAIAKPAYIIESGPAAGVIAGAHMAKIAGHGDVITVDMGGTTAKAALVQDGKPSRTTDYEVGSGINVSSKLIKGGGYAVKLPFIDVSEIGAGGGSLITFDEGGLLHVGPESAGSVPGPVCYDQGGTIPTLTDSFLSLGYLNPQHLAGGQVKLNAEKARAAMKGLVASKTGGSITDVALGVQSVATATMARAVKAVSTYIGRDPRDFTLFAFGGNGPMIAVEIAKSMGMKKVVIPFNPGVFSAMGLLFSDVEHEFMQTDLRLLSKFKDAEFVSGFEELKESALKALADEGYAKKDIELTYLADLRYEGQAYELIVELSLGGQCPLLDAEAAFNAEHAKVYGHASPEHKVELVSRRVRGRANSAQFTDLTADKLIERNEIRPTERKGAFEGVEGLTSIPVVPRRSLEGTDMAGPLIVEEYDSTCVIPPNCTASLDAYKNIVITVGE